MPRFNSRPFSKKQDRSQKFLTNKETQRVFPVFAFPATRNLGQLWSFNEYRDKWYADGGPLVDEAKMHGLYEDFRRGVINQSWREGTPVYSIPYPKGLSLAEKVSFDIQRMKASDKAAFDKKAWEQLRGKSVEDEEKASEKSYAPPPRSSLFTPSRHKYLHDIISKVNPEEAKKSAEKLVEEFNKAGTRMKKVRVKRATIKAANMAFATMKRKLHPLSEKEMKEFKEIGETYKSAYEKMKL